MLYSTQSPTGTEANTGAAYTTVTAEILMEKYGANFRIAGKKPILEDLIEMPKRTLTDVVSMVSNS